MNRILQGQRIVLRPFRPEDVDDVFAYASDPETTRFVEWEPHRNRQETATYIERCRLPSRDCFTFAVEHRRLIRVIGAVDIRVLNRVWRTGEIGYTIARPFWGQGYNIEAGELLLRFGFEELRLRRIQALCDVANRRSYRTMEKLGMVRDRVILQARFDRGIPIDRYCYVITRRAWERRRAQPEEASPTGHVA